MRDIRVELIDKTEAGLQKQVDLYFKGWHPFGYGTRLVRPVKYDEDRQCWVAVITRQTSCDQENDMTDSMNEWEKRSLQAKKHGPT